MPKPPIFLKLSYSLRADEAFPINPGELEKQFTPDEYMLFKSGARYVRIESSPTRPGVDRVKGTWKLEPGLVAHEDFAEIRTTGSDMKIPVRTLTYLKIE